MKNGTSKFTPIKWRGKVNSDIKYMHPGTFTPPASWANTMHESEFSGFVPVGKQREYQTYHPDVQRLLGRPRLPSLSQEWFAERLLHLTGTNLAPLLNKLPIRGKNPYESANSIFKKKTGRGRPFSKNYACAHGTFYEPEAIKVYSLVTGRSVVPEDIGLVIDSERHPFLAVTPDAVLCYESVLIEIKCPYTRTITHDLPEMYYPQVQMQMYVSDIHTCHFVQYKPPNREFAGYIDIVEVKFDPEWWLAALNVCIKFWATVVTFYEKEGAPIGTQLIDWKVVNEQKKKSQKRTIQWSKSHLLDGLAVQPSPVLTEFSNIPVGLALIMRDDKPEVIGDVV